MAPKGSGTSGGRKPAIHVTPHGNKWARTKEGAGRASSLHDTNAVAESAARPRPSVSTPS